MIYRHTPQQIQEYYDNPAINQSALKAILKVGVEQFITEQAQVIHEDELFFEEKEHFLIGKAVDCLLTEGKEVFDTAYFYSKLQKKPGEKPMAIVKKIFETTEPQNRHRYLVNHKRELYDTMNSIVGADGKVGYYLNNKVPSDKLIKGEPDTRTWEDDKRYLNLLADGTCQAYWDELQEAGGKRVLTESQNELVQKIYNSFTTHHFTRHLFNEEIYTNEHIDIIYQLPCYWIQPVPAIVNGAGIIVDEEMKCLIDATIVNHSKKQISPFDAKTTGFPITRFNRQIKHRRYDIQGSVYMRGLNACKSTITEIVGKPVYDYNIQNFAFVAESTVSPGTPLIFPLHTALLDIGEKGDGDEMLGWRDAIQEYVTYKGHNCNVTDLMESHRGICWVDSDFEIFK